MTGFQGEIDRLMKSPNTLPFLSRSADFMRSACGPGLEVPADSFILTMHEQTKDWLNVEMHRVFELTM